MATKYFLILMALFTFITGVISDSEVTFFFENACDQPLWLGSWPADGDQAPLLGPGVLEIFYMSDPWKGGIWARTKCTTDTSGYVSCETGDCRTGTIDCQGPLPNFPATFLNFQIYQNVVTYEVSLLHGHNNFGVRIAPDGGELVYDTGSGPCPVVDCVEDISNICPAPLVALNKEGVYVGCNSPCDVFHEPQYCCLIKCKPNEYSKLFKQKCNLAHTYPGDDTPPLYSCKGAARYNITFCPLKLNLS